MGRAPHTSGVWLNLKLNLVRNVIKIGAIGVLEVPHVELLDIHTESVAMAEVPHAGLFKLACIP